MQSPIKEYKRLLNIDNISDIAYNTLFTSYIEQNLKNSANQLEWSDTNQEELMIKFNGGYPIPGFIYTFIYPPINGDEVNVVHGKKPKKYNDYVPLVFCFQSDGKYFKGINLNALPATERVKFLEVYHNMYKGFFKNLEKDTENGVLAINKSYVSIATSNEGNKILEDFSKISGANFKFAYRTYFIGNIKQLRMIEYSKWNYIPHYNPKDAFKLMNQKEIHNLYWKTNNR